MKFFDMHCDTLMVAYIRDKKDIYEMPGAMLDVARMKSGGAMGQFFAIFMPPPPSLGVDTKFELPVDDNLYIETCLNTYNTTMANHSQIIAGARNYDEIMENEKQGKMSGILTFEDGRAIDGSLEKLKEYYNKGIRLISLTWNHENCFGFPNSMNPDIMSRGLKPFGKEAVSYMNDLGIIIDVSHLSDAGFNDVASISTKPFVASHSNCRGISPHQRNLTDEMIKVLAEKGGVMGINFAPSFLTADTSQNHSTVDMMVPHILHMIDTGGIECAALGSDLDGISGHLEVNSVDKMQLLLDGLHKARLSDDAIEKIAYKNVLRVIKNTLY